MSLQNERQDMRAIATVPAHVPFLDTCATRWLTLVDRAGGVIVVPGRRAARGLMEAFLRRLDGEAALLPRIVSVGDLDDDEIALGGDAELALPPAVTPARRLSVLAAMVLRAGDAFGTTPSIDQAWPLARALADLMDEAERSGCDLASRLPDAAEPRFAAHWHQTLQFLEIVTAAWPAWLAEAGVMNPVARQVALVKAQADMWRTAPVDAPPIWAIGFSEGMASVAGLLDAVSRRPNGCVVLPGVDLALAETLWGTLPESHPQAGLARLLGDLDCSRAELEIWGDDGPGPRADRVAFVSTALLPPGGLPVWGQDRAPFALNGVWDLPAPDQQHEAVAIALILRDAVEQHGRSAALVTPDRQLARRVATELRRFGVLADDSAGEALSSTPPAVFLRLLAAAVADELSPVSLLSLLKHPLAAAGLAPGDARASARLLERRLLRGPAPPPGIAGLRARLTQQAEDARLDARSMRHVLPEDTGAIADAPDAPESIAPFLDRLEDALTPILRRTWGPLPDLLAALVEAAENLAQTDEVPGAARLWAGEDGHALSTLLADLLDSTDVLPEQPSARLESFLLATMAGQMVRGALRPAGRDEIAQARHPRVFIWGVLEARLQAADLIVLGGLNEGIWPPSPDPGPWLSRPMRTRVGLPSPERAIGAAAHDFAGLLLAAPTVVLSRAGRLDGAPAVPARWLVRFGALLGGRGQRLPRHPALDWMPRLDQPDGPARAVAAPRPTPPVALRPRQLSVTEIETWLRDPYAIYAKHILRLRKLSPLEEDADHADYGTIVHRGLDLFLAWNASNWPKDVESALASCLMQALEQARLRPALAAWWRPRLLRIAAFVAERETLRRAESGAPERIVAEVPGLAVLKSAPGGPFRLTARADRIELYAAEIAAVIDYKTGQLPRKKDVKDGWSPQLVLEAAMLSFGGFGALPAARATLLEYWRLTGDRDRGETLPFGADDDLEEMIVEVWERLLALIAAYDDPAQPYLSHPSPKRGPAYADYAELARYAEWSAARDEEWSDA
jgi:ATP-dependent helicase/nuclease subunit B